jgi:L-cysteine:1D-myo-inositol 2-amino-2-deoxy-alpha-D-glucopyranoside ligase
MLITPDKRAPSKLIIMESWPTVDVPALPAGGPRPRLYDSAHRAVVSTPHGAPEAGPARIYVCGITPYDATHIGHAATYLAYDLVQRLWRDAGYQVTFVQNVTDVDDPLLERATATGEDWRELADREIQLFRDDMLALRILPPAHYVGAVEAIDLVVEMVGKLRSAGAAYQVDDDLYFSVHADPGFGDVSGYDPATMRALFAERGGDPDRAGKRDPLDCLLWQAERPGEPAWDTELGRGRPGWHVECAAIALRYLGSGFDVQGGGSDLLFPHHEMGASEAQVATGERPFAHAYVHHGMVGLDGEKMSKSKGNLVLVSTLRESGVDPMAIRLAILDRHYRADWDWTDAILDTATARLARWRAAVGRPDGTSADATLAALRERLADDLDTPGALAAVDAWAAEQDAAGADADLDPAAPGLISRAVDALLGVAL